MAHQEQAVAAGDDVTGDDLRRPDGLGRCAQSRPSCGLIVLAAVRVALVGLAGQLRALLERPGNGRVNNDEAPAETGAARSVSGSGSLDVVATSTRDLDALSAA